MSERGGVTEIIAILVSLAILVGLVGCFAWFALAHRNVFTQKPTPAPTPAPSPTATPTPTPIVITPTPAPVDATGQAFTNIKALYATYGKNPTGASKYVTPQVQSVLSNEAVFCTSQPPASFSFQPPEESDSGNSISVTVSETLSNGSQVEAEATASLQSMLVSSVSCP